MIRKNVAVIGGGISGLCCAYELRKVGVDVTLFEGGSRVGGNIKTEQHDGFLIERGPNSTLASVELLDLLQELGISDQIAKPSSDAKRRFIVKNGRLVALPSGPFDLIKGGVFSLKARVRLLKEPFVHSRSSDTESVAAFFERRLGKELVEYAVDPFISGIYAGDPQKLSIKNAFPKLYQMEQDHGSIVKAGLFGKRKKARKVPKGTPSSITFRNGMQTLSDAIERELKGNIRLETGVDSIAKDGSGQFEVKTGSNSELFDSLVLSTTAYSSAEIIKGMDVDLAEKMAEIYYPPVSIVYTGFRHEQVASNVAGFGFLVPGRENRRILGSLWTSSVFEGRAPAGHHLFTTFIGGSRNAELCDGNDEELVKLALEELRSIVGVVGEPVFVETQRWKKAIPQYNIGYEKVLAAIDTFRQANPEIYFCGNYYKGISVSDCIKNAGATAREIVGSLSK